MQAWNAFPLSRHRGCEGEAITARRASEPGPSWKAAVVVVLELKKWGVQVPPPFRNILWAKLMDDTNV